MTLLDMRKQEGLGGQESQNRDSTNICLFSGADRLKEKVEEMIAGWFLWNQHYLNAFIKLFSKRCGFNCVSPPRQEIVIKTTKRISTH